MSQSTKLRAISHLGLTDGLSWQDQHDIAMWVQLAGNNFETAQFSDKTIERIATIYHTYFAED